MRRGLIGADGGARYGSVEPVYLKLPVGELAGRAVAARELSVECVLCPRECRVDRIRNEAGECGIATFARISSASLHHGEEPPISGVRGSGTIFFSGCNLHCVHCQNYPISQLRHGKDVRAPDLADAMLDLQNRGAHNINLVTPSHVVWPFIEALVLAVERGLRLPIVYNSSGYDGGRALELLHGVIDVYMPDLKYADDDNALRVSDAPDYWRKATEAISEMHRQVGGLRLDRDGVAERGLLVRHLVLPGGLSGTGRVLRFLAEEISAYTHVSLMRQYFPADRAAGMEGLDRRVSDAEWQEALSALGQTGLENGWVQGEY